MKIPPMCQTISIRETSSAWTSRTQKFPNPAAASAPNAALGQKFISFVLGPQGQAIMRSNGFVVISPALANPQAKVPASIKPLTAQWPSSGG